MRFLLLTALLCARSVLSADCNGTVHNAFFGLRAPYDQLDFMDHIVEDWKLFRVVEKVISYPLQFQKPNSNMITYIEVLDQTKDGNNGCAYLVSGGPGYNYTDVKFKSKRNRGMDFVMRIYVKRYFK